MKNYRIIILTLLCYASFLPVSAQSEEKSRYVRVDKNVAEDVAKKIIEAQKDADSKEKGWAESLLREAFEKYFASKNAKAIVYEKAEWDKKCNELKDSIKSIDRKNSEIASLRKQVSKENIDKKMQEAKNAWELERKSLADSLNAIVHSKDSVNKVLSSSVDSLNKDNIKYKKEIDEYQKSSDIAKNVTRRYNQKMAALDVLFKEYKNSQTLEYVIPDSIKKIVADYSDFLNIIGIQMPDEQKTQIDYLQSLLKVAEVYKVALDSILNSKYNEQDVKKWEQSYNSLNEQCAKLNDGQKTVVTQVSEAVSSLGHATNYFKEDILVYLKKQGQIPDKETIDKVKKGIEKRVGFYSIGKYADENKFNPLHTNLNNVLKSVLEKMDVMDETAYENYLSDIEKAL